MRRGRGDRDPANHEALARVVEVGVPRHPVDRKRLQRPAVEERPRAPAAIVRQVAERGSSSGRRDRCRPRYSGRRDAAGERVLGQVGDPGARIDVDRLVREEPHRRDRCLRERVLRVVPHHLEAVAVRSAADCQRLFARDPCAPGRGPAGTIRAGSRVGDECVHLLPAGSTTTAAAPQSVASYGLTPTTWAASSIWISWLRTSTVVFPGPANAAIPSKSPGTGIPDVVLFRNVVPSGESTRYWKPGGNRAFPRDRPRAPRTGLLFAPANARLGPAARTSGRAAGQATKSRRSNRLEFVLTCSSPLVVDAASFPAAHRPVGTTLVMNRILQLGKPAGGASSRGVIRAGRDRRRRDRGHRRRPRATAASRRGSPSPAGRDDRIRYASEAIGRRSFDVMRTTRSRSRAQWERRRVDLEPTRLPRRRPARQPVSARTAGRPAPAAQPSHVTCKGDARARTAG